MLELLSPAGVSRRFGLHRQTVNAWWHNRPGYLPEPDALVDGRPAWTPETIDAWRAARPGHGGRPRKHPADG